MIKKLLYGFLLTLVCVIGYLLDVPLPYLLLVGVAKYTYIVVVLAIVLMPKILGYFRLRNQCERNTHEVLKWKPAAMFTVSFGIWHDVPMDWVLMCGSFVLLAAWLCGRYGSWWRDCLGRRYQPVERGV